MLNFKLKNKIYTTNSKPILYKKFLKKLSNFKNYFY